MTPAFQVKEFLTLSGNEDGKSIEKKKTLKVSTKTQFVTKFCCRQENLKELLSFYNVAARAISNSNSFTKIIGLSGEGGIGKSRLISEFVRKISSGKRKNVIKINYSDKNNFVFQNEFESIRDTLETKIKTVNKSNFPAIIILEDLHWYEAEEKKKIEKILFAFSGELPIPYNLSVIIIATHRITKREYNFQKFDSFEDMQLMPLSESESNEFIKHSSLIKKNKISKSLKEKIISLSTGIPFFLEEFLKSFTVENGKEVIPDSIERLLSYKLSFIHEEILKVLQIIAAWDGSISEEIFKNICLKLRLTIYPQKTLIQTGIIRVESKNGEVSYSFAHDIYKNYIAGKTENYFAIIIHRTIAGIFEKSRSKSEHILFKLYHHYKNCNETDKAYEYLEDYINKIVEQREYESALHRIDELIQYYAKSGKKKLAIWLLKIKCLRMLIRTSDMKSELDKVKLKVHKYRNTELYLNMLWLWAEYYLLANDFTKAFRAINIGVKLSKKHKISVWETKFQFLLARNLNTNGKIKESLKEAEKLLTINQKVKKGKYYYWAKYFIANSLQTLRRYKESSRIINKSISELQSHTRLKERKLFLTLQAKYFYYKNDFRNFVTLLREIYLIEYRERDNHSSILTLLNIADCLIVIKEFKEANEILFKINSYAEKQNSTIFLKRVYEGFFNLYMTLEDYDKSEKISLKLIKMYDKNDYRNLSMLYSNLIIVYFSLDDLDKAYKCYEASLNYANKMGKISDIVVSHFNIGFAYYLSDEFEKAEQFIKRAYFLKNSNLGLDFNFEIDFLMAEILLVKGQIRKSIKILENISICFENSKENEHSIYYNIFCKLLQKSNEQKKFKEFFYSVSFNTFLKNIQVSELNKLKIIYYILLLSQSGSIKLNSNNFNKVLIGNTIFNIESKNKIILFYFKKIPN